MTDYINLLKSSEDWLMNRILEYAEKFEFTKYTSTLAEAWRLSISGLSDSIISAAHYYPNVTPELHPDDKYINDPISEFGIIEAKKHRQRGTTLAMFLGLMKYYKESYMDLIENSFHDETKRKYYKNFTRRCFDRIEIAYCIEWTSFSGDNFLNELQNSNRKMTNEKNKYLTIFESSYAPIILLDENQKILNLNQAAIELFTNLEVAGAIYYNDNSSEESFKKLNHQILQFLKNKPSETNFETNLKTNKGDLLFQVKLKKMQDISKKFGGTVIMLDDITERKKAEEKLTASEKHLSILNTDKDRFISILGHDLKNPFNSVLGFSEILIDEIDSLNKDKIKDYAKNINKSANNANSLLEDILMWARTQQGSLPFKPKNLSLTDVCKDVLITLKPTADAKNIAINYTTLNHLEVYADTDMLKTILRNLVSNAIKFTKNSGMININAEKKSENITISVSDNGVGISTDEISKLFVISEVHTTTGTAQEKGTGLGLLICKEFVEKHQGKIWVESEVEKGSDFKFTLPYNAEADEVNIVEKVKPSAVADNNMPN